MPLNTGVDRLLGFSPTAVRELLPESDVDQTKWKAAFIRRIRSRETRLHELRTHFNANRQEEDMRQSHALIRFGDNSLVRLRAQVLLKIRVIAAAVLFDISLLLHLDDLYCRMPSLTVLRVKLFFAIKHVFVWLKLLPTPTAIWYIRVYIYLFLSAISHPAIYE